MKLSSKIVWLVASLALLFGIATNLLLRDTVQRYAGESARQWTASLVHAIAEGVARNTIDGNRLPVRRQLQRLVSEDEVLAYIFLVDFEGRLFAHSFDSGFPVALLPRLREAALGDAQLLHTTEGDILDIAHPLIEGMTARVHVGVAQQRLQALVDTARRDTLLIIVLVALPGIFFAMLLGRRISRPLQILSTQVQAFGQGAQEDLSPIEGADPEVAVLVDVFRDMIRARTLAYVTLEEREEHLSRTLDSIGDAVISTDAKGRVTRLNPIAEQLTGWDAGAAEGRPLREVFHIVNDTSREPVEDPVQKVLETGRVVGLANHTVLIARDGKEYPIADSGAPIRNQAGSIIGVILVFRDVSEEYRLQAELLQHREHLEELVEARSRELAQSNAALRAALKELESFSYSVSHDLRAPLRSVIGFTRILEEDCAGALDDDCRVHLRRIVGAAHQMSDLIDTLLTLSRISSQPVLRQTVDLGDIAGAILQRLHEAEPGRRVQLLRCDEDLTVEADPKLVEALLDNLLGNAWKYTAGRDPARIELGVEVVDGERVFFVRDNGAGFDMCYVDRLFTAFQRLHGAEFEGSGIGLATAARIVRRHGGRIWGEGEPGRGATFSFTLEESPDTLDGR
ncbi:MAG TPA: PAS domain S-box protein [Gammaproteobacteria bacterium]|nr:PAS domain S-box protein [Gammaproteobacteria bacterium]